MRVDMLERLKMDPGTRTLGELLQERQWAVHEIERLRSFSVSLSPKRRTEFVARLPSAIAPSTRVSVVETPSVVPASPSRMLRLSEVQDMVGLSRSTIYQMIARGRFPAGIRVGERARRWRLGEIVVWQEKLTTVE